MNSTFKMHDVIKIRYFICNNYNWISRVSLCLYSLQKKKKQTYYRTYHKPLPIFASSAKRKAMRLQVRFVFIVWWSTTFQFYSTYNTRSACMYGDISFVQFYILWYFRVTSTWSYYAYIWIQIHINIYTCYFCMNIIHLYLFCVLWRSVVSQIFCITYSRIPFLCLVVLLPLGGTKRILYYLLFDISVYTTYVWRHSNSMEAIQRKYSLICLINR